MSHTLLHDESIPAALDGLWIKLRSVSWHHGRGMELQLIRSYVLLIARSGEGRLTVDLDEHRLRPDTVYIARPGQTIGVTAVQEGLDFYVFPFDARREGEPDEPFPFQGEIPVYPETQTGVLSELLYHCSRSDDALERFRGQSAFQELLYWTMKRIRLLPDSDSKTALERTRAYIESHYHESLTIEQLARMAEISPKYYVDLFKKTYGKSAIDYVTEARVNGAKQLMMHSDARLRDIAHQVGYSDEFYFSRKFKQAVGMSPTAYMKKRRRKIVAYTSPILGQLLALKMIPYAAPLHPKWTAYYHKMYRTDIPVHLSAYRFNEDWEANIEALRQAHPDMIISHSDNLHPDEREQLEKIAPVYCIPLQEHNWREQLQLTAQLLEASQEADCWLDGYERKAAAARELLHRELKDETVLAISVFKQNYYVCPVRGMRDVLYGDLQLHPARGFDPAHCNRRITQEQLAEFDADRILVNVCQEPESLAHWQSLQSSPLWLDLKAVRRHRVYTIRSDPWREYSASAIERMLNDAVRLLYGDRPD
ncbi:AraC family transcriptional regulator [Paenibacillus hodogayensis]|uniref:AraC family transcriptional regulator n=1 Tax=Paenibacillus hodogayensis TaxID=279208 RepID=A0ABV5VZ19_9BACL